MDEGVLRGSSCNFALRETERSERAGEERAEREGDVGRGGLWERWDEVVVVLEAVVLSDRILLDWGVLDLGFALLCARGSSQAGIGCRGTCSHQPKKPRCGPEWSRCPGFVHCKLP